MSDPAGEAVLEVRDLVVTFDIPTGPIFAVNGVDFTVSEGETLSILGESGCGKSAAAKAVVGILPVPPGRVRRGSVRLRGRELTELSTRQRRDLMGAEIAWIPQDPLSALHPSFRIGYQMIEGMRAHMDIGRREAAELAVELLSAVGLPEPRDRMRDYPHQLSGGMQQRVLIAMAIGPEPSVLIADEPTTALDVTIQAEIVFLLKKIQTERNMALVLITHDCSLAGAVADRVAIMYGGMFVETGSAGDVFSNPAHPYTRGLMQSTPSLAMGSTVRPIPGTPPTLREPPSDCPFAPRCSFRVRQCEEEVPPLSDAGLHRRSACFRTQEVISQPRILQLEDGMD